MPVGHESPTRGIGDWARAVVEVDVVVREITVAKKKLKLVDVRYPRAAPMSL